MNKKRDYYEVLGLSKSASDDEIKKAYRIAAKNFHPDREGGDEEKFKEAKEAYECLSDPQKRSGYDQFGHDGPQRMGGGPGGFGGFNPNDIFSTFFRQPVQNQIPQIVVTLTFEESVKGVTKMIQFPKQQDCPECCSTAPKSNLKSDDKKKENECPFCKGKGKQKHPYISGLELPCDKCNGTGKTFDPNCKICRGSGKHTINVSTNIVIPVGIANGTVLQSADVIIVVNVQPHKVYQRNGNDLHREVEVDAFGAMLGTSVIITTLENEKLKLTIPAGTQFGTQLKLGGKGIDANGVKGSIICHIKVTIPKLTEEQRKVLEGMMPIEV